MSAPPDLFVTGATTVLGLALVRAGARGVCSPHASYPVARDFVRLNAEDGEAWREFFDTHRVDTLIHAAGVCDVGRCERDPSFAWRVNVGGVEALLAALPSRTRLVYISSDHVFGGREAPYTEEHATDPISAYGRTRVAAEERVLAHRGDHLVVRVGLPLGPSASGRTGHVDWLRSRTKRGLPRTVVAGEFRSAVWAEEAARRIVAAARTDACGVRHVAAPCVERPELARRLCEKLQIAASFSVVDRAALHTPHLGRVELSTVFSGLSCAGVLQ